MTLFFLGVLGMVGALEVFAWFALTKIHKTRSEFPPVTDKLLSKFTSWDPHLGWCNPPNVEKLDRSDRKESSARDGQPAVFRTDSNGSRTPYVPVRYEYSVSCYGDSYCMSRDVEDDETWPWYLGCYTGARISNYGVGNYGLDQALLRLERDFDKDPADIVILSVVSITMARAVSVYRHYLESGNVLAVKPRFILTGDGSLELVPHPCREKSELKHLSRYAAHFRRYDEHYGRWKRTTPRFPFTAGALEHTNRLKLMALVAGRLSAVSESFKRARERFREMVETARVDYELSFWESAMPLFVEILNRYARFVRERGSVPVFLLQHQKRFVDDTRLSDAWKPALEETARCVDGLVVVDSLPWITAAEDIDSLYRRSHHSPEGNRLVAVKLAQVLENIFTEELRPARKNGLHDAS